jgi:hypothetical protein
MPYRHSNNEENMRTPSERLKRWLPSLGATALLWAAVGVEIFLSVRWNNGHLVYALDDSYILMAMAKNLAHHGVWGMTPFGFTSSSSAPLWTALVGGLYWLLGVHITLPLILNLLCATLAVFATQWVMASLEPEISGLYVFAVLLAMLFFSPVLNLIFIGLEHSLHILLTLLFVFHSAGILARDEEPSRKSSLTLLALGAGLGSIRYEGLFAIGVVGLMLLFKRHAKLAITLVSCSILPPFVMGAISVYHGWFWLPNSVVLKGNLPMGEAHPVLAFFSHAANNTFYSGMRVVRLAGAAALLMVWLIARNGANDESTQDQNARQVSRLTQLWMIAIFLATAVLHMMLASTGWFLRYEAYLMALGIVVVAVPLRNLACGIIRSPFMMDLPKLAGITAALVLIFSAPMFWAAGYNAVWMTVPGMHDTYRWHYQMAQFVQRYYAGKSLVINDIGAADFFADIHLTDPHGLADPEIARARLRERGQLDPHILDEVARRRGAKAALVDYNWVEFYGGSFRQVVPSTWLLAGVWKYHNRVVLAPAGLSFYALNETDKDILINNLRDYSRNLPPDVEQAGPYTQHDSQPAQ